MAVLVGVDATPDPGLRGPTNFAGTLTGRDLLEPNQTLEAARCANSCFARVTRGTWQGPHIHVCASVSTPAVEPVLAAPYKTVMKVWRDSAPGINEPSMPNSGRCVQMLISKQEIELVFLFCEGGKGAVQLL